MTSKLEVLKGELEALEAADGYGESHYDYLVEMVERLEAEEKTRQPAAQAPAAEPDADPVAALVRDLERAALDPDRLSDAERDALVARYNHAVAESGRTAERIDVAAVIRDMATAKANPDALSHDEHDQLVRRYNQAIRQGPERRTSEALRGELAGGDLPTRMRAAAALQERGELDDATAGEVVSSYNAEVEAANERGLDVAALPPELQEAAKAILAAQEALDVPADPVDAALHQLNQAIRGMKPPTLEEQLAALGVQVEPEPEQVSTGTSTVEV